MDACPFFGRCGGCAFDFSAPDYQSEKLKLLPIVPDEVVWITAPRRRAEFQIMQGAVGDRASAVGFFARHSNDIVAIDRCPLLDDAINAAIPGIALSVAATALITKIGGEIEIDFNSAVKIAPAAKAAAGRITWNGKTIFGTEQKNFRPNGFLQPTIESEKYLADFVRARARVREGTVPGRVADLFSGNGALTAGLDAARFDIFESGNNRVRDLNKRPLRAAELNKYKAIVLDPPRAGALAQCREIARSAVPTAIYISCNPETWLRDKKVLESGGFRAARVVAIDQFRGSSHWEIASVFDK